MNCFDRSLFFDLNFTFMIYVQLGISVLVADLVFTQTVL